MIINPVTITMSNDEAERVWAAVDKRIKGLGDNSAERLVLERALDALGAAITAAATKRRQPSQHGNRRSV